MSLHSRVSESPIVALSQLTTQTPFCKYVPNTQAAAETRKQEQSLHTHQHRFMAIIVHEVVHIFKD